MTERFLVLETFVFLVVIRSVTGNDQSLSILTFVQELVSTVRNVKNKFTILSWNKYKWK